MKPSPDMSGQLLAILDMTNAFTRTGALKSERIARLIDPIERLANGFYMNGGKIVFIADRHLPGDPEFEMFPEHGLEGTVEAEIVDELKWYAERSVVVPKRRYSGFAGTDLDKIVSEYEPEIVTVVGDCTDICVNYTVADFRNRDMHVHVIRALVDTFDAPGHDADAINEFFFAHMKNILGAEIH